MQGLMFWLEHTGFGTTIRETQLWPLIDTAHVFGIIILLTSTTVLSLRLMGVALRDYPVKKLAGWILPWTWAGFTVQLVSGFLLFSSESTTAYTNLGFRIKMLLLLLAGVNALVFNKTAFRHVDEWDVNGHTPVAAKLAGAFSILLWFGVVAAGRWHAFIL